MATVILEDGRESTVTPANAKQGFTLVIDENGKLVGREVNDVATTLARAVLQVHDVIVGPALLCSGREFK
jgi:hypothetical protein